jgi:hypothetical protein
MVQLPAVNTPQFDWARNRMPDKAKPLPPIFQPEAIAREIVRAAFETPRELWIGGPALKAIIGTMVAPRVGDALLASEAYYGQLTDEPRNPETPDNLFTPPPGDPGAHGRFDQEAETRVAGFDPRWLRAGAVLAVAGLFAAALAIGRGTGKRVALVH